MSVSWLHLLYPLWTFILPSLASLVSQFHTSEPVSHLCLAHTDRNNKGPTAINMRLHINNLLFFLAAAEAAVLPANQPCGNNKECESNCENGTYHIASSSNSTYFACTYDGVAKYSIGECLAPKGSLKSPQNVKAVCESVGGETCKGACAFIQDDSNIELYKNGCIKGNGNPHVNSGISYEKVQKLCGN